MKNVCIGGDNSNPPMYIIEVNENKNIENIDVYSCYLKCHFQNKQYTDFQRYVQLNQKQLNDIGFKLIENQNNWNELNKLHDLLHSIYMKHLNKHFDKNECLKKKYYRYSVIAYRCCFVKRKYKTIDYINQILGIYANKL